MPVCEHGLPDGVSQSFFKSQAGWESDSADESNEFNVSDMLAGTSFFGESDDELYDAPAAPVPASPDSLIAKLSEKYAFNDPSKSAADVASELGLTKAEAPLPVACGTCGKRSCRGHTKKPAPAPEPEAQANGYTSEEDSEGMPYDDEEEMPMPKKRAPAKKPAPKPAPAPEEEVVVVASNGQKVLGTHLANVIKAEEDFAAAIQRKDDGSSDLLADGIDKIQIDLKHTGTALGTYNMLVKFGDMPVAAHVFSLNPMAETVQAHEDGVVAIAQHSGLGKEPVGEMLASLMQCAEGALAIACEDEEE